MLLIDSSQLFISSIIKSKNIDSIDIIRHIILNSLRMNVKKFKDYNEVVICSDSRHYWRKDVFPFYKAHRKESREKSTLNWDMIFKAINLVKSDIKEYFPYKLVEVYGAEADDVIGTLTKKYYIHEPIMIVSSDKDFIQLQQYEGVKQFNPMLNVFVTSKDPLRDLKEKIIRGDGGDNVPNILSNDDIYANKTRQKRITSKNVDEWVDIDPKIYFNDEVYRNYCRNDTLINFNNIPQEISESIIKEYNNCIPNKKTNLYKYFVNNKMIGLLDVIEDF